MATEGIRIPGETYLAWEAPKDPDDVVDYDMDWSDWLGTDTISTSIWTFTAAATAGLVQDSKSNTTTVTKIWFSAGTAGNWEITNRVVTAGGRTKDMRRV